MKLCRDGWVGCDSKHLVCDMGCIDVFVKKNGKNIQMQTKNNVPNY